MAICCCATAFAQVNSLPTTPASYGNEAPAASGASGANAVQSSDPFNGSVPEGKATALTIPISFKEAIDRALRNNLGILLQSDNLLTARGQKWKELSSLLPNVNGAIGETVAQQDLAAFGFKLPGVPKVIGPYNYFDARAYLTQSLFDLHALERERGASANQSAAAYAYKEARDVVVLVAGNAYLLTLSSAARVETAAAQVETAQALSTKAADQQSAGVIPAIDSLRARVELQTQQQLLITARNNYAKQKLGLARIIGLPPGQEFELTDKAPYAPLAALGLEQSLERAYASRSDYQALMRQVQAAEYFRRAATAEYFPSLNIAANYGDLGVTPGNSHGTFQVTGSMNIPIFQGGRPHADALQAEAVLRQNRAQLENLRGQIDYEVRSALLDLTAAADQVEVARSSVDLANQALVQARDRFAAGVSDNLEVVQAQEALAAANESYISSLYAHNVAKVALARAMGYAEAGVREYLSGK
ncbi:MAG: TolC family protein [Acidobacteriales bacterium]|nr:TolC family protein [Terriglobales bacterium]